MSQIKSDAFMHLAQQHTQITRDNENETNSTNGVSVTNPFQIDTDAR